MVRKDVKIGAVVLAILLAVIVVYVLVVPSGKPTAAPAVANADDAFKEQMKHNESRNLDRPGAASNQPAIVQPGGARLSGGVAANDPSRKTDPFADTGEKWMMALNTGAVPQTRLRSGKLPEPGAAISPVGPAGRAADGSLAGNSPISIDSNSSLRPTVKTHTVETGDSIARIAESIYGSQVYYREILAANPGVDPKKLKPGMVLKIPDVKEVRGKGGAEDDSPAPAIDGKLEYRVTSGDSMHGIAKKLYGKSELWEQIYDINKAKIGNDPAKLKVGMILKLPSPPTQQ